MSAIVEVLTNVENLVDLSNVAREFGIHYPVTLTKEVWQKHMLPSDELLSLGQTAYDRVRTTLHTFAVSAPHAEWNRSTMSFDVCLLVAPPSKHENIRLRASIVRGAHGEPVVVLMM